MTRRIEGSAHGLIPNVFDRAERLADLHHMIEEDRDGE